MEKDLQKMSIFEICMLHAKADRALRLTISRALEAHNVSMMQWLLLSTVAATGTEGMRMSDIAASLEVTMPQVTALMNDLSKKKLVKQKVSTSDRRSRRLIVAPQAQTLLAALEPHFDKEVKRWLSDVPANDLNGYFAAAKAMASFESTDQNDL